MMVKAYMMRCPDLLLRRWGTCSNIKKNCQDMNQCHFYTFIFIRKSAGIEVAEKISKESNLKQRNKQTLN